MEQLYHGALRWVGGSQWKIPASDIISHNMSLTERFTAFSEAARKETVSISTSYDYSALDSHEEGSNASSVIRNAHTYCGKNGVYESILEVVPIQDGFSHIEDLLSESGFVVIGGYSDPYIEISDIGEKPIRWLQVTKAKAESKTLHAAHMDLTGTLDVLPISSELRPR